MVTWPRSTCCVPILSMWNLCDILDQNCSFQRSHFYPLSITVAPLRGAARWQNDIAWGATPLCPPPHAMCACREPATPLLCVYGVWSSWWVNWGCFGSMPWLDGLKRHPTQKTQCTMTMHCTSWSYRGLRPSQGKTTRHYGLVFWPGIEPSHRHRHIFLSVNNLHWKYYALQE